MTIWNIIILTAVFQGILLSLFLLANKKGNRTANFFLACLVLLFSVDIGLETLYASPNIKNFSFLIGINDAFFFLYGPLLYFYVYFLTSPQTVSNKRLVPHLLPFLLVLIAYVPLLFLQNLEFKLMSEGVLPITENEPSFFLRNDVRGYVGLASGFHQLIYFGLTLWLIKKHQQTIKDAFSAIEKINLSWLKILTFAIGVIVAIDVSLFFFVKFGALEFSNAVLFISLIVAFLIYTIGYFGLMQPTIFSHSQTTEKVQNTEVTATLVEEIPSAEKREKYQKSTLTEAQSEQHLASLLELMQTEQLYLEGELKLLDVAEKLNVSTNNLSQIINEKLGKNFYDFVNEYRVETAKELLLNPKKQHLTLLAIAFDSGFNSKSSFNNVFKKQTSLTPSEFKKQNLLKS
jgi:AraC-like DNA-binding protein